MATAKADKIEIPALDIRTLELTLIGDTPLLCHAWSQKAKMQLREKSTKKASAGKAAIIPHIDFAESLYWLTEKPEFSATTSDAEAKEILDEIIPHSRFGFPNTGFKESAVSAGLQCGVIKYKINARAAFFIQGEFAEIIGTPTLREDIIRIQGKSATPRHRAEFKEWATKVTIQYNASMMSAEQIANLFRMGGFAIGVGDWRPARGGTFGMYHVGG